MKDTHEILDFCQQSIKEKHALSSPYLTELINGGMTKETFIQTQVQFFHAVAFFSRPMSVLMSRMPDPRKRLKILENIVEEHGNFNPAFFHESTFKEFLKQLSPSTADPDQYTDLWPELKAFNSSLMATCSFDHITVALCCMGTIELMFAQISSVIGHAVVKNKWIQAKDLQHYTLHEKIDLDHANDFFYLAHNDWNSDNHYLIEEGIHFGIFIFKRLYDDLYNH